MEDTEEKTEEIQQENKAETPQETPQTAEEKSAEKSVEKPEIHEKKEKKHEPRAKRDWSQWYDKKYKTLLIISIAILAVSLIYIGIFYAQHGDIMAKDVSLTGGTIITVYTDKPIDVNEFENSIQASLGKTASIRTLENVATRKQIAFVVETQADADPTQKALEDLLGYELDSENSSIEVSGATLSHAFYKQLLIAIAIAFAFMAITVFIIFRTPAPCLAVIIAGFTDIVGALAIANLFGFKISTAGIAAFLMLVGYSVDTDVMLTIKVIKRRGEGALNSRIAGAAKTGLMMTVTSFFAVLLGFFIAQSPIIKQIFFILSAGLFVDMLSTWLGNAAILKWWCEKKKIT